MSIEAQIADMASFWPHLRLVAREGRARPGAGPYDRCCRPSTLRSSIERRSLSSDWTLACSSREVTVLSPPLRRRPGDREGALPHVYYGPDGEVTLCMLDPDAGEWSPEDSVAQTTVPWIIDWLAAYEGWRATGQWTASGRHIELGRGNV